MSEIKHYGLKWGITLCLCETDTPHSIYPVIEPVCLPKGPLRKAVVVWPAQALPSLE